MKLLVLVLIVLIAIPALLAARDLKELARRERQRRQATRIENGGEAPLYTETELTAYGTERNGAARPSGPARPIRASRSQQERDRERQRAFWEKETRAHRRELARLDARIRRLEWRLAERRASKKPGERLRSDPGEKALEQSLDGLREERRLLIESFLERGRKAGALPGWLR